VKSFFDDRDQNVYRDGDPDLRLDGVLGGSEERLDPKMLFDPFEKQLDLPALLVKQGDAFRGKGKIVGEKHQVLFSLGIEEPDAPQMSGILLRRIESGQCDRLIGFHSGCHKAAVSSSLLLGGILQSIFLIRFEISNLCHCALKLPTATALGTLPQVIACHQRRHFLRERCRNKLVDRNLVLFCEIPNLPMK